MIDARSSKSRLRRLCVLLAGVGGLSLPVSAPASPSSSWFAPETLSAMFDLRLVAADRESSWTDGGFGKARFDGRDGALGVRPVAAEATLVWEPALAWDVTGTLVAAAQHAQDNPVDLIEAFLSYKPLPRGGTRFSGRAGLFWPPVSLEHEGAAWSVADMVTPSAINSWIGEEVKLLGVEATAARDLSGHRLSATLGLFGFNDTAGTLLAFRGWALHDQKATAFGHQPLPTLNPFMQMAQAPTTKPLIELDNRPGFYGRLSWRPSGAPLVLDAFYYDNRGDPTAVDAGKQWGWRTRFFNAGARLDLDERTRLIGQALTGTTLMGFKTGGREWVETRYRAGFFKAVREVGPLTLSGRADLFDTRERGSRMSGGESEHGWSVTAAASWSLSDEADLMVEALHIDSVRGVRVRDGLAPAQEQNVVQAAVRLTL